MIIRAFAIICGLLILAAVAHATIIATGGYWTPQSYLTLAIAGGVGLGGILSGMAWSARRRALAVWLVVVIAAGEAFGLLSTAERLIVSREVAQAPLRQVEQRSRQGHSARRSSRRHIGRSAQDVATPRGRARRKSGADQAAIDKSAERGCRENCRALLQAQVDAAATEIEQARADLARGREKAEGVLTAARVALAAVKAPVSPTPSRGSARCVGMASRSRTLRTWQPRC